MSTSPHALPPSWINILTYFSAAGDHSSGLRLFETDCLLVRWPRAVCHFLRGATAGGVPSAIRISRNCTVVTEDAAPWSVQLFDIPSVGRSAVLTDPQGAVFSVLKPSQQP